MKELVTHMLLGYRFWTLFQALAPMIWFYPLNELEISGYEAFAVVIFSPLFLGIRLVESFCTNKFISALIKIFSSLGLLSFNASTTLSRLVFLVAGVFFQVLSFSISLTNNEKEATVYGTSLGLLLFVASRVWLRSFVPAWWDEQHNIIVFTICLVATLDSIYTSFISPSEKEPLKPSSTTSPTSDTQSSNTTSLPSSSKSEDSNWVLTSLCFGSLAYTIHCFFGEASVITRWTGNGYPDTGPLPYPWGAVIFVCLCMGLYTSWCEHMTDSLVWWLFGGLSMILLYALKTWTAFGAGCVLAVFTISILPTVLTSVSQHRVYKVIPLSMLVWVVQVLFSVWNTAYNFVPGGVYTRERTGSLLVAVVFCLLLYKLNKSKVSKPLEKIDKGQVNKIILVVLLIGLAGYAYRLPSQPKGTPTDKPTSNILTCAIWTFHFGYDNKGWPSLTRAAEMLRALDPDVITLLESDASKPYLGNNDLAMWLSEELNMFVDFGPSTSSHTWGNLLLSKYPIIDSTHHLLPSPHGELAPAISATIDMGVGKKVDLVVTHMGNDRDNLDRKLQAETLTALLEDAGNPAVFLGYVTSEPFSRDYRKLTTVVKDIDPTDQERWCEYIMYKNLTRLSYARISHGGLSDTEIQAGKFMLGLQYDHELTTTNHKLAVDGAKFSAVFGGHRQGHYRPHKHKYHMDTPKYFIKKSK